MLNQEQLRVLRGSPWGQQLSDALLHCDGNIMEWMEWMERHTKVLKSDRYSKVGLIELDKRWCYLKHYQGKSWGQRALFKMGVGRGFSSFDSALALIAQKVRVPEPLSCVLIPGGMMLLTEAIRPARDLKAEWLAKPSQDLKLDLMWRAGQALQGFHGAGYSHGDCKWSNFLWSQGQFYFVDLEAVAPASGTVLSSKRQARDVARFVLNAEDQSLSFAEFEPFFRGYLGHTSVNESDLIDAITPILRSLRRRHERHYGARGTRLIGD